MKSRFWILALAMLVPSAIAQATDTNANRAPDTRPICGGGPAVVTICKGQVTWCTNSKRCRCPQVKIIDCPKSQ